MQEWFIIQGDGNRSERIIVILCVLAPLYEPTRPGITLNTVDGIETLAHLGAGKYAEGMTVATRRAAALSLKAVARSGLNLDTRDFSLVVLADVHL